MPAVPMTAVGKVYKPRLRAEATRHAMAALLEQHGLADRVEVHVKETSGELAVRYEIVDATGEAAVGS